MHRTSADATWLASMPEHYDEHLGPALFAPHAEDMAARVADLAPARVLAWARRCGPNCRNAARWTS